MCRGIGSLACVAFVVGWLVQTVYIADAVAVASVTGTILRMLQRCFDSSSCVTVSESATRQRSVEQMMQPNFSAR
jgi:hypothetical protein